MDKQQEIKIIQSLKGDTYFNQFFCDSDIDLMCENIRNDFAIESGCQFNLKAAQLQSTIMGIAKNQKEFNNAIAHRLIDIYVGDTALVDSVLTGLTTQIEIIKYKKSKGYALSGNEIDYLISKASE